MPTTESVDLSRVTLVFGATTTRGKTRQATRLASGAFDNVPFTLKWPEFSSGDDALAAMLADRVDIQEAQPPLWSHWLPLRPRRGPPSRRR